MSIPGSLGGFGGQDPFAELLGRFFGMSPASSPPAVRRVPIGRLLTDSARDVLAEASARAEADGSPDLDTEHLLWAATEIEPPRSILVRAGADPDRLAKAIEAALPGESGTPSAEPGPAPAAEPGLTPAAKRVLLAAHARSQASGTSYIGAEHILAALLDDPDSGAGRFLHGQQMDPRDVSRHVESRAPRSQSPNSACAPRPRRRLQRAVGGRPRQHRGPDARPQQASRAGAGNDLGVTDAAKRKLIERGHQPEFGARPLRRTLQTELDKRLATLPLDGTVKPGDTIVADVGDDGELSVAIGAAGSSAGSSAGGDSDERDE